MMEINFQDRYPDQLGSINGINLQVLNFTSRTLPANLSRGVGEPSPPPTLPVQHEWRPSSSTSTGLGDIASAHSIARNIR